MQRPFTSGSRQAPDPFDQFLEDQNFYRKHTARDASCLFRVISEQMYDTQLHHLAIRKKCVRYMRKHHKFFQPLVDRDLDEYLDDMSKPKTYGTLIELQAVGYMFQRNVLLFEPFNLGNYFNHRSYLNDVFRVFYTPERHFDSVFTCDYIKDAAICQSICYEILYKDLYKLPDVSFAVEQMLHAPTFEATDYHTECNADGYCTRIHLTDGRVFDFDLPQATNCILENYKLCHFHYTNFPRLSDDLQRELKIYTNRGDDGDKTALSKTAESLLPHKYVSCVRQLLQEGITPFPYKVAKALDPNMYRNIEFDAWNEARKELKLQNWYNGDTNFKLIRYHKTRVHKIFQVGAKCHVKLRKSENDLYTCHIQEIAVDKGYCIVFIEQLGEKRLVPYDSLTPLPPDQFKPWSLPYRFQRHKYSSVRFTRHHNYRFKFNGQFSSTHEYCGGGLPLKGGSTSDYCDIVTEDDDDDIDDPKLQIQLQQHRNNCAYYKLKQFTHLENFRMHTVEYCTMPLTVEHAPLREIDIIKSGGVVGTPQHGTPSSEGPNSRAPSRTSNKTADAGVGNEHEPVANVAEHYDFVDGQTSGGVAYVPEFHGFYQMQPYPGPEDYYSFGYGGAGYDANSLHPHTALMPAGNGGGALYYMCNPPVGGPSYHPAGGNNFYIQTPTGVMQPPPYPLLNSASTASPNSAQSYGGGSGSAYYPNPYYPNVSSGHVSNATSYNNTSSMRGRINSSGSGYGGGHNSSFTPLSGRINWEAKRSVKPDGVDLPSDAPTLRYFYNLGLDYHQKLKRSNDYTATDFRENVTKLATEMQSMNLDENTHLPESKSDASNNMSNMNNPTSNNQHIKNAITSNQSQPLQSQSSQFKSSQQQQQQQQRRNSSRFVHNNKERHNNYPRNLAANSNNSQQQQQQSRYQNDYNAKNTLNAQKNSNSNSTNNAQTPNSSRPTNANSNLLHIYGEPGIQTSPKHVGSYDATNMPPPGVIVSCADAHTPNSVAPHFNMSPNAAGVIYSGIGGGTYDYGIDPNAPGAQLPPPGGVYIQMPSPYALYTTAAAPPPPPGGPSTPYSGAYMGPPVPPPPQMSSVHGDPRQPPPVNGLYAPTAAEAADNGGDINGGGAAMHFQYMGYPPPAPMQFYYSSNMPPGGVNSPNVSVGNPPPMPVGNNNGPHVGPQTYWGPAPPPPPTPVPAPPPPTPAPAPPTPARNILQTPQPSPLQTTNNSSSGNVGSGGSNATTPTVCGSATPKC